MDGLIDFKFDFFLCNYVREINLNGSISIIILYFIILYAPKVLMYHLLRMEKEQVALWFPFGKSGLNLQITLVSH